MVLFPFLILWLIFLSKKLPSVPPKKSQPLQTFDKLLLFIFWALDLSLYFILVFHDFLRQLSGCSFWRVYKKDSEIVVGVTPEKLQLCQAPPCIVEISRFYCSYSTRWAHVVTKPLLQQSYCPWVVSKIQVFGLVRSCSALFLSAYC